MNTITKTPSHIPAACSRRNGIGTVSAFLMLLMLFAQSGAYAQGVGISESAITPDASAILELRSTTRGFLMPRNAATLGFTVQGLSFYNTTSNRLNYYSGAGWLEIPVKSDNLSVFASTTSAQLRGILSDPTGTGSAVFGTGPSFTGFNSTGATVNINASSDFATNINTGTSAGVVSIGSVTGAAGIIERVGTGNYSLDGVTNSTYTIGASTTSGTISIGGTAQTGAITLGSSSATQTVSIGSGAGAATVNIAEGVTNAKTINVGTGAAMANTIDIGGTGANVVTIANTQTGGSVSIGNTMTNGTIAIGGGSAVRTGSITIGSSGQTSGVTVIRGGTGAGALGSATSGIELTPGTAGTINIGAAAGTGAITLGSSSATQTVSIGSGAGAATVNIADGVTNAKTINIGSGAAMANTIAIGGTGANVVTIADAQTGGSVSIGNTMTSGTIAIGGGSAVRTGNITVGSSGQTSGVTVIRGGTGTGALGSATSGIELTPGTAGTINIGAAAGTGAITLGSSTAVQTLNLGVGTGSAATINIGTGATGVKTVKIADGGSANVVTIGDNTGATSGTTLIGGATVVNGSFNYGADAGASDTYAITLSPAPTAYTTGMFIIFRANTANTGAATLNVNGLGAITIVKRAATALANNDIGAGRSCMVVYNGTNFILMNPVVQ